MSTGKTVAIVLGVLIAFALLVMYGSSMNSFLLTMMM
jgi:hypothetical protein